MGDRIGQQFGNYRLVRLLGKGGAAEVYLGEHIHLDTQAAIKVLHTQLANDDVERFRTEARIVAHLMHPHIVRVLEFGVEGKTPFLVMEYAPHGTMRTRYPKGSRLPLETIVTYVKQVTDALYYIHKEKKLVHRDVKPQNMLLRTNQDLLLSDFGIVVAAHTTGSLVLENPFGTEVYMAPEQFEGKPRPASDQYALGIVVYEWLCGKRPFDELEGTIKNHHLHTPPPPLQEQLPTISPAVDMVVLKALAKNPKERFVDIQAFATALEQASGQALVSAMTSLSPIQPVSSLPSKSPAAVMTQILSQHMPLLPLEQSKPTTLLPQIELVPPGSKEPTLQSMESKGAMPLSTPSPTNSKLPISILPRSPSWGKVVLFIGLVLVIIASAVLLYPLAINSKANSLVEATATAHARATSTAEVPIVATAKANATATAVVNAYNTATASGVMSGFDAQNTNFNPYEKVINPTNVSELVQGWVYSTGSIVSPPAVTNGVAYVLSDKLYAFNATGCGHPSCSPLWTASITFNGLPGGWEGSPAVAEGVVYVISDKLYAFNATGCGHPSCSPLWTASLSLPSGTTITESPVVANGIVYATSEFNVLYAFNAIGCGHPSCSPLWIANISFASIPVIANGVAYVLSDKLYAFNATGCGHPSCSPLWAASIGGSSFLAIADGIIYTISTGNRLYAFKVAGCGHPSCSPLWTSSTIPTSEALRNIYTSPAIADGIIYIASTDGKLYAFNALGCGHPSCSPLWTAPAESTGPLEGLAVANGVVYVRSSNFVGVLYAFNALGCGHLSCSPLWTSSPVTSSGSVFSPVIANGIVYVNVDDQVYAFHLPSMTI